MSIENEISGFSRNAQELTSSVEEVKKNFKLLGTALARDLANVIGKTVSQVESSSDDVANFTSGISTATRNTLGAIGSRTSGKAHNTVVAAAGIIKIADMLIGGSFKHVQEVMQMTASVADIGVTATVTTSSLVRMAEASGKPVTDALKVMDAFNNIGTSLTRLGPTTGKAVEKLFKVFDNREDQLKYLKQGMDPDTLIKYQAEGVKYLTGYGVKMAEDDITIRKGTLAYVDTLTTMSILTGESRDQVASRLASMKTDVGYQIKMRELIKSGNGKAAAAMDNTMLLLDKVSPELKKGMADFFANGTATTAEGKKMMLVMGGKASEIAREVEEGRMTGAEAARAVAVEYQNYINKNKKTLTVSKELQDATGINGKVLMETERLALIKSEAEAKQMVEETAKKEDTSVNVKNAMINTERELKMVKQRINQEMMPYALMTFQALIEITKATAFTFAKLAYGINGGKYDANLEKIMALTGSKSDLAKMEKDNQQRLLDTKTDMERLTNPDKRVADLEAKSKAAEAEFNKVSDSHAAPAQIDAARTKMQNAKAEEYKEKQEIARVRSSGVTKEQLQKQYNDLQIRGTHLSTGKETATSEGSAEEQLKLAESLKKVDLTEANKYINFGSGSGSKEHWAMLTQLNSGLAKNVTLLAQEYFNQSGKKLNLTSAVRTYSEQKSLYDGWVAAGGDRLLRPKVYVPGHGNVMTPGNPDNGETPHMRGVGVDISQDQLDFLESNGSLSRLGLKRPYRNDPVHIEKAKFGKSMIQGKEIEMHGREALIELFNGTIPINLPPNFKENTFSDIKNTIKPKVNIQPFTTKQNTDFKDNTFSDITNSIKPKVNMQSLTPKQNTDKKDELDLELLNMIDSQFDDLIASMDKSNLLQHSIKTYMAA
jgi:hypothetical protein